MRIQVGYSPAQQRSHASLLGLRRCHRLFKPQCSGQYKVLSVWRSYELHTDRKPRGARHRKANNRKASWRYGLSKTPDRGAYRVRLTLDLDALFAETRSDEGAGWEQDDVDFIEQLLKLRTEPGLEALPFDVPSGGK